MHPGNEQNFLSPSKAGTPVIMDVKRGETNPRIIVYSYSDRIDVVKQYRKKVVVYSLISEELQHSRLAVQGR
ncbi:YfmQ family protein [Bacillus sp. 22-7]|uniref:YfmQ family protein n=1 Tax=Cytobacillus sp. SAFR-174 TaxID=3436868 RepID=UPI00256FB124|nr:YfmQ family protein [Bacillus sp. 22-7]